MQTIDVPTESRSAIPRIYDENLGQALFEPFAADLTLRIPPLPGHGAAVLELACGTGKLTGRLRRALPSTVRLVAIDLSHSMLDYARDRYRSLGGIEWESGDMSDLGLEDASFDAVFCQFGAMFCDDKQSLFVEAARVLKRYDRFIFSVWDSLEFNDLARTADAVIRDEVPDVAPLFETAYGYNNHREIRDGLFAAGFKSVEIETVHKPCIVPSARQAAVGFVQGTPAVIALEKAGMLDQARLVDGLERKIARLYGDRPVVCRMQAVVTTAHKG